MMSRCSCPIINKNNQTGSVLTIHNLAFQGQFWHWDMLLTGLDWKHFNWKEMEFYGHLNLLKTGIAFSDYITTVSPTYAQEIQGEANGAGLDSVLTHCADRLVGILNGVDMSQWNRSAPCSKLRFLNRRRGETCLQSGVARTDGTAAAGRDTGLGHGVADGGSKGV